jgi:DNA sulfur modification protein DndD
VILDELVLQNFGTFAGRQILLLTPPASDKPVVLIGGLNGAGKTTVLEAIHLALYGALAQPVGRRSGSYENYLTGLIHHGVAAYDGASVELAFHAYQQGVERRYRIRRSWRSGKAAVRERVDVEVDGRLERALTSTWNEHVETFLPRGIAGLFFFDGEQIEALADLERSRQVLGSALAALLGLDLVERLTTDLSVLRRRHRTQQVPDNLRETVEERQRAVTAIRQAEEAALAAVASARVDLECADKRLFGLTERYRSEGGVLLDQHEAAEARRSMLRAELSRAEDELRDELGGAAPLLQATSLLSGLAAQAHVEAAAARERVVVDVVTGRDQALLGQLRQAQVHEGTIAAVEDYLATDRAQRRTSADIPDITSLKEPGAVDFLLTVALPTAKHRLQDLIDRRRSTQVDLDQAERLLIAIPDPESLAPLRTERDDATTNVVKAQAYLAHAEDSLASLRLERARADAAYETAMDRAAQANLEADDDKRLIDHVDRVRVTLEGLRSAATRRHLARIGDLILEALNRLLRKECLITEVAIDADSHALQLTGSDGRQLPTHELSAGERQLLAVALLWGLARAAGQPLPVVIDTPLGRLDGSHRENLLDRYFPYASHQVILLSTDTEIDEEAYERLRRHVGRSYRLEFDPATNATTVQRGYFWE